MAPPVDAARSAALAAFSRSASASMIGPTFQALTSRVDA